MMREQWQPRDEADVLQAVADAMARRRALEIVGRGSRRALGRPVEADAVLDLSVLNRVLNYEPDELVLTVQAAAPLAEVEALLAREGQYLAFEPPDLGALWGVAPGAGTVGGAVSVGLGGPRRVSAGGPRDHLLGFRAVNGFGQAFAGGGRVVKNVTGYDTPKLMTGAFGTLGVLTELTLKVLPAPQTLATLRLAGLDEAAGLAALRAALASRVAVSAAAHLPPDIARTQFGDGWTGAATLIRLEGVAPAVASGLDHLQARLEAPAAILDVLDPESSRRIWRDLGGAAPFAGSEHAVWRLSAPPAVADRLGAALRAAGAAGLYYDWGGGLIWAALPVLDDDVVRPALARVAGEGHATLVRAPDAVRAVLAPFQPMSPGVDGLTRRLKARFDPLGLFNPGRMYEGV